MKTAFKASFLKAIKKIGDKNLKAEIADAILDVEEARNIKQIRNLKKLKGYEHFYRIRLGNYRVGIVVENDVVIFAAFDNRADIYKYFP